MKEHEFYDLVWQLRMAQRDYWRISIMLKCALPEDAKKLMPELEVACAKENRLSTRVDEALDSFYGIIRRKPENIQKEIL